ncbi:unnamed protein product, partial [Larinioides sclopetarius]
GKRDAHSGWTLTQGLWKRLIDARSYIPLEIGYFHSHLLVTGEEYPGPCRRKEKNRVDGYSNSKPIGQKRRRKE